MSKALGPVALAKSKNQLPKVGTLVKTSSELKYSEYQTSGFLVNKKYIDARKESSDGIFAGYVADAGGDLWWIRHDDETVAAYSFEEVFDR